MTNDQANVKVTINTQEAQRELEKLQGEMKRLIALKKKAEETGDVEGYKRIDKELKKVSREANKLVREHRDLDQILKNINGASVNELRQAQRALTAQTNKLNRNTDEYVRKKAQLKLVSQEIKKINSEYRHQQSFVSRATGAFNKYFGMVTAALASIAGLSLTIRQAIKDYTQFDDKLADVMKTTGLTKEQVLELNKELQKIDTRTSQEQLLNLARVAGKLGITAEEEILGFVWAADQISVALGEDLGGAEDAVRELGKLTDIFKLKDLHGQEQALLKIGSAINELGMASTANEAYLVEFSKRTAGIAPQAGVSVQNILGLAATLDSLGQKAEMSSTAYSKLMTTMTKKTAEFANIANMELGEFSRLIEQDANEAMIRVFEGISKNEGGFQQLVSILGDLGIEGQRMTSVFGAMANNTELLREQQALANKAFREGTSLTDEFNIKNNNAQANLEKARKGFAQMRRELGERLIPAYTSVISKSKLLFNFINASINIIEKYGKTILIAGSAIVAYTAYIRIHNAVKRIYNQLTITGTTITKAFNTVVKSNPVGLLVSLLTAAATAYFLFKNKATRAKEAQSEFNKVVEDGNNLLMQTKSLEERASIVENLSAEQLQRLKSDLQEQIKTEEDFHATLLQKLKKRLQEDKQLKVLHERRSQAGLTEIQKINLSAQINARKQALARELEDQNKSYQQRLTNLKTHLAKVDGELKKRPESEETTETGITGFESTKKALESAFAQEQNLIKQQLLEKKLTQAQFNQEMYSLELAHLTAMRELYRRHGEDFITIEGQIIDKKLAWQSQLDKMLEASTQLTAMITEDERKMFADIDKELDEHLDNYTKNLDKETQTTIEAKIKEKEAYEAARKAAIQASVESGMAALENAETADEAGRAILNVIRDQIKAYLAKAVAAQVEKILSSVPPPLSLILAAVAGGATAALFNKLIPKFYAGGYTSPGPKMEPVGIVHAGEYVVPQEGLENPQVKQIVDIIELARRAGDLRRLDLSPIINVLPQKGLSQGGYTSRPPLTSPPVGGDFSQSDERGSLDQKTIDRLINAIDRFEKKRLVVYTETFKKDLEILDEIEEQRGL